MFKAISLVAQMVKHLPTLRETRVRSLGQKDPLEKETHSSTLAWRIPWMEEPAVHGVAKSRTRLSDFTYKNGSSLIVILEAVDLELE